jgi:O-acetyl-ADP-ribose deacetylase (regulator of RNase III)
MIVLNCDLTTLKVDIIVNAANKTLLGGGGVDGMIHRKSGPRLREECMKLKGCEVGEAKITDAYNLHCKKIIHTVGPIYRGGNSGEEELLSKCYSNSMKLAEKYRVENGADEVTIAFPCISTGAFGYPKDKAALLACNTIKEINSKNVKVIFACYEESDYQLYVKNIYDIDIDYFS